MLWKKSNADFTVLNRRSNDYCSCGKIGSGKSTVSRYLSEKYGFQHLSYSALLKEMIQLIKGEQFKPTRTELQDFGSLLTDLIGHQGLTYILLRGMVCENIVIDGIRYYEGHLFLSSNYKNKYHLIYREVPIEKRFSLYNNRVNPDEKISFDEFKRVNLNKSEENIDQLKTYAHKLIPFIPDQELLNREIDKTIIEWENTTGD